MDNKWLARRRAKHMPKRPVAWLRRGSHDGFTRPHFGRNTDEVRDDIFTTNSSERKPRFSQSGAGFTLIELMVVIAIIGILSSAGYYQIKVAIPKAKDKDRVVDVQHVADALILYVNDNGSANPPGAMWGCVGGVCLWIMSSDGLNGTVWTDPAVVTAYKDYGGLPTDPKNSGQFKYTAYFDTEGKFCCQDISKVYPDGFDSACAGRYKGRVYVIAQLEIPKENNGSKVAYCSADSYVTKQIPPSGDRYFYFSDPVNIF